MLKHSVLALGMCALGLVAFAQKGTAPSGFYPANYHGDTFTGIVADSDGQKELTLEYLRKSHKEIFVGAIEAPCVAPTKDNPRAQKELRLSSIPKGTVLTVFYNPQKITEGGRNKTVNSILAIRFDEVNGQKLTNPGRPIIPCSKLGAGMNLY